MKNCPISLQLWSIKDEIHRDFEHSVRTLAKMGYDGVEMAGYGNVDCETAARVIQDTGLKCVGMHVPFDDLRGQSLRIAEEAATLKTKNVICPYIPPILLQSASAYQRIGLELDRIGAFFKDFGIQLHYHNHDFELETYEGKLGITHLLASSSSENVQHEADLYWISKGGIDPSDYLIQNAQRLSLLHLKNAFELGSGPIDYRPILKILAECNRIESLIIEVEWYQFDPMESVEKSLKDLQSWLA